jgi:hypothetical protein
MMERPAINLPAIIPLAIFKNGPAETPTVEPFFIRCETCRARLRVRDERFLGQVQSCPKCGSMVQIVAPAVVMPQADAPAAGTEASVAGATSIATLLRSPSALVTAGGAAVLLVGGLIGMLTLGGEDEVALAPTMPPAVEVARAAAPAEVIKPIAEPIVKEVTVVEDSPVENSAETEHTASPDAFLPLEPIVESKPDASEPPTPLIAANSEPAQATRTLTLEVVEPKLNANSNSALPAELPADYANVPEVEERAPVEVAPPVLAERPDRRTNVDDQLSVAIDAIELPAMPIGKFVKMISEMSAVPIRLDPKVLGDAGLSTQTKVVVQGGDITLGDLLARVLKEHQLTCVERDGELVVVRAKQ